MADFVSPTIDLVRAYVTMYTDFRAFKDECTTFRRSLCNVIEVLEDVQEETSKENVAGSTRLGRPMELLQGATKEGGEVLRKCSAKNTLIAFVSSRQLMGCSTRPRAISGKR
jgi:hypothetical protein